MRPETPQWHPEAERQALFEAEEEKEDVVLNEKLRRVSRAADLVREEFERIFTIRDTEMKFPKLLPELQKRGWDKPILAFYEREQVVQWLNQHNFIFEKLADYPDAVVMFQLPLPVARFWWKSRSSNLTNPMYDPGWKTDYNDSEIGAWSNKGGVYWPESPQGSGVEEWGGMYWRKMQASFKFLDQVRHWIELEDPVAKKVDEVLKPVGGWGERLNDLGFHDAKNWYYVWGWWLRSQSN